MFFGIPIIILVVGFVLFSIRPKHRKTIGVVLFVSGSLELSLWLILTKITVVSEIMIYVVTIILGIISLYYASKIH